MLAPRGLRRCPARAAAWAAQPSPLPPSLSSPLPPHNPSSTQAPSSPHPKLTAEAAVRWDSHPMLGVQAAEESKLPPGPILPLLPLPPPRPPNLLPRLQQGANPLPLPPRRSLLRLQRANPLPQVSSWLRKEPIPSHCRYLGCDESQSPPPSLRWRCGKSQSPPTACYLAAAGSQSLHQGSWRSCRKEPAHPWAASVSSRRRTQGRAAPPSPVSQPGWRSERALGGRGATLLPVASCLPSPLRTGQRLLQQLLRES